MPRVIEMEGHLLYNKGGDMFFAAKTIDDRLSPKVREHVARWLPNQIVTWRHESPRKPQYAYQPVFGRILVAKAYENGIASIVQLYGNSPVPKFYAKRKALQELVKKSIEQERALGLSLVFDNITINGDSVEAEPMEVGVTPRPDCVTCTLKYGVKKMVGEQEKKDPVDTAVKEKIDEALDAATIEELQSLLESKTTELETEKKASNEGLSKLKTELESKEARIKELEKGLADQKSAHDKLVKELEDAKRKPVIDALKAEDKKGLYSDKIVAMLEIAEIQDATKKLKEQNEVVAKITVTSLETSATNAQKQEAPPPKKKRVEEMETVDELKAAMDIDTDYGKALVAKIRGKQAKK
jgi:hypothetical protein